MRLRLPAKLSAPRVHGAVPRPRLFDRLSDDPRRALLWLSAPAGSGKTTLVATYLAHRRAPALWYRVDDGDGDGGTFFSFLAQAAASVTRRRRVRLPLLTPEHAADVPRFARHFFRALFAALPEDTHLVFDGFERAPSGSLDPLVLVALEEAPPEARIVVTSREAADAALMALLPKGRMQLIQAYDLRLTLEETTALASAHRRKFSAEGIAALHTQSEGWAAGLVALLAQPVDERAIARPGHELGPALFPYFAQELFARMDVTTRELLLRVAVMTQFTAKQARRLSPDIEPEGVLRKLYRANCFIDRSTHTEPSYRFHALFREYLLHESRATIRGSERAQLLRIAANAHREHDELEDAIALLVEARAWPELTDLLCDVAPQWLDRGRHRPLVAALLEIPDAFLSQSPWLLHWLGIAELPYSQSRAREHLEAAYGLFDARRDTRGRLLATCGVLNSYWFEWNDMRPLDLWCARLRELVTQPGAFANPSEELRTLCNLEPLTLCAARHRALLEQAVERAFQLVGATDDAVLRVMTGNLLCYWSLLNGDWSRTDPLLLVIEARVDFADLPPALVIQWYIYQAARYGQSGQYARALSSVAEARRVASDHHLHFFDAMTAAHAVYPALNSGDLDLAHRSATRMRELTDPGRAVDMAHCACVCAFVALAFGRLDEAEDLARQAIRIAVGVCAETGAAESRIALAYALVLGGDYASAMDIARQLHSHVDASGQHRFTLPALMVEAFSLLQGGAVEAASAVLARALAHGRARRERIVFPYAPIAILQPLFVFALQAGIEADYVRQLVRVVNLPPPNGADEHWPWLVRVITLGRFEVQVDDTPLRVRGKQPRKPLELLKAIIGFGARDVRKDRLLDVLWPEARNAGESGDTATAFDVTLHRLRKLLGRDDAVLVENRLVSLNSRLVWTDVRAVEQLLAQRGSWRHVDAAAESSSSDARAVEDTVQRLLFLYRGAFLPEEPDCTWTTPVRTRLVASVRELLAQLGTDLERAGRWQRAREVYERAIDIEPLAEVLYRGLMRCLMHAGENAAAIDAFRRCRTMLSVVLGAAPSGETEALYRRAMNAGRP